MPAWHRLFAVLFCLAAPASPARAISLLNGSVITANGLTMTVSGCSVILSGITQSSCAAGHIVMQALSSGSSGGFALSGDGNGGNGGDVLDATSWSGVTQVSFTLSVVASGPAKIGSATTTIHGWVPSNSDLYNVSSNQHFSVAAGGGTLSLVPANSSTSTLSLNPANSFSVSNTFALNTSNAYGYGTFQLMSVQTTFAPVPEPASIAAFLTGLAGLCAVRRLRRSIPKPLPSGGEVG